MNESSSASRRGALGPAGGTLLARGREAEVWDLGDGTVLKLFFDASRGSAASLELKVLASLRAAGVQVPSVRAETVVDGRPGIVMERIPGEDLLAEMGRRPWKVLRAGPALARTHVAINDVCAPEGLPSMTARLRARLTASPHLADEERARLLKLLAAQGDSDRLCHGDLHLENLLGASSSPTVIDWSDAATGPPAADVARTWVILRLGEPPEQAPVVVRRLAPGVRRLVISQYLAAYRAARPDRLAGLAAWQVLHAAVRLGETTATESASLRSWLDAARVQRIVATGIGS